MAIEYNAYNPLSHGKLRSEVASARELLDGLELIRDSLEGDEAGEYQRTWNAAKASHDSLAERLREFDEHVRRKALRACLVDKARRAIINRETND
jgi:hypothetical protein